MSPPSVREPTHDIWPVLLRKVFIEEDRINVEGDCRLDHFRLKARHANAMIEIPGADTHRSSCHVPSVEVYGEPQYRFQ